MVMVTVSLTVSRSAFMWWASKAGSIDLAVVVEDVHDLALRPLIWFVYPPDAGAHEDWNTWLVPVYVIILRRKSDEDLLVPL